MTAVTMQEKTSAPASVEATKDIVVANIGKDCLGQRKAKERGHTGVRGGGRSQSTNRFDRERRRL